MPCIQRTRAEAHVGRMSTSSSSSHRRRLDEQRAVAYAVRAGNQTSLRLRSSTAAGRPRQTRLLRDGRRSPPSMTRVNAPAPPARLSPSPFPGRRGPEKAGKEQQQQAGAPAPPHPGCPRCKTCLCSLCLLFSDWGEID